jgi:PAS domain S-box-containing protein
LRGQSFGIELARAIAVASKPISNLIVLETMRDGYKAEWFAPGFPPFASLLENLPVGAYTCEPSGLLTYFNKYAVQIWGREPKLNDPIDRFCGSFKLYSADGEPIPHDKCWMALALKNAKPYVGEEILIERPDGQRINVLAHANPIWDEAGRLAGAVNVLVDISDRKRADEAQALLAAIVESSDDAIVSKTLSGRILSWNAGAQRLFGYTALEAVGSPITMIIPHDRLDEEKEIIRRLKQGERIEHFETVRVTKDGRHMNISLTISPVRDSSDRIFGASKIARDITARKQADEAMLKLKDELAMQLSDLRRVHEMSVRLSTTLELQPILDDAVRMAAAIEGTDMGLLSLIDASGEQLEVGASLGFTPETLRLIEQLPNGSGTCLEQQSRVIVEDTETDPLFASYREVARRVGFRAVHSTPLITRSGKIVGVLSTHFRRPRRPSDRETHLIDLCARQAVDFIENARLYAQLREADQRKDEFLATLAHELRNPLAPISNSLHILRLSGELPPAADRVRAIMERQVNQLVRLVDDLLEVSRITRGKIELRKENVELAAILDNAIETSRPLIDAAGHQLAISISPEMMTVEADPVRLSQVVSNLLNNAAKYTDQGGQIWLSARREGAEAFISVRDNGLGIPPEMLPRVFDMFAQVDRTLNRSQGGLGIGLTLSKNLVQMHRGKIEVRSEGAGRGSEFIVTLPLVAAQVVHAAEPLSVSRSLPRRSILIVDDTRAAAYVLGKLLEAIGQRVRTAASATAALDLIRLELPDVVISDIAMPDINGYELARQIRNEPAWQDIVLVALTGYGQETDRQRAKEAGFDMHLVKPVGVEALETLLANLPHARTPLLAS